MEVHVAQVRVLRGVEPDADRRRVAVADLEIDIAHRRVESSRTCVRDRLIRRHAAHRWKRNAEAATPSAGPRGRPAGPRGRPSTAGKHHHYAHALLEPRRIRSEHEHRPRRAVPEDPHARPRVDRPGQPVPSRRHEQNACPGAVLRLVDRRLDRGAIVRLSVAFRGELGSGEIDRLGILQPRCDHRCGGGDASHERGQKGISNECVHGAYSWYSTIDRLRNDQRARVR